MGIIASAARGNGAFGARLRDIDHAAGLWLDAGRPHLHHLDSACVRNVKPHSHQACRREFARLEALVAAIDPTRARQTAALLLARFGTLSGVFSASFSTLSSAIDDQSLVKVIVAARSTFAELLRDTFRGRVFDLKDELLVGHLIGKLRDAREEQLHAAYFDPQQRLILDEFVASGDESKIAVRIRPILRRAIELDATWIVFLHNHPSGDPRPSALDRQFTNSVRRLAEPLGIGLLDHLIVSDPSVFSMRTAEFIQ